MHSFQWGHKRLPRRDAWHGRLTGVTSGADQAFVAFFGALVAQGVVDNDANKAKVFELIIMLREGAKDSRKRALAAAGVGGVGLVAPTRAAFLAAANQVCTNLRIGAQPTLLLAEKHYGNVWSSLREAGRLHSCLWDFSAVNDSEGKTERRTQIGDLSLVQNEQAGVEAMRNGAILVQIMSFLLTIMVAADGAAATAVPGNDKAFTAGAYGRVTAADGAEVLLFVDWPELFQYYMMMVAASAHVTPLQYKALHKWYFEQVNANMSATGNNISSALMAVMAMAPATQAAASVFPVPVASGGKAGKALPADSTDRVARGSAAVLRAARMARVARAVRAARGTAATSPSRAAISTRAGDASPARAATTTFAGLAGRGHTASGLAPPGGGTAPNAAVMAGASAAVTAATGANRIGLAGSMPTGVGGWVRFLCVSEARGGWLVLPSSWLSRGLAFSFRFRRRRREGG